MNTSFLNPGVLKKALGEIVAEVRRLAVQHHLSLQECLAPLLKDPFTIPALLERETDSGRLRDLFLQLRERVDSAGGIALNRDVAQTTIREIIESIPGSPFAATFGGSHVDTMQREDPITSFTTRGVGPKSAIPPTHAKNPSAGVLELNENSPKPVEPGTTVGTAPERRWINAEIDGHDRRQSLAIQTDYVLVFDVALAQNQQAAGSIALPDATFWFAPHEDVVQLTVQIDSKDFIVAQQSQTLKVPRSGPSIGKARFDIRARNAGTGVIVATFHKDGNFISQLELTFTIGDSNATKNSSVAQGRNLDGAFGLAPRDLGLLIRPAPAGGYDCVVWGAVQAQVRLPITETQLTQSIENVRGKLMEVVMQRGEQNAYVFQAGIAIEKTDADKALVMMRAAGALLFEQLFFSPDAGADVMRVGEFIRAQSTAANTRLKLQIVSYNFPVPWPMLYVGSPTGDVDWECFLGMRHIIEQIPLQPNLSVPETTIASNAPTLAVGFYVNEGIDQQMNATFVARQRDYWNVEKGNGKLQLVEKTRSSELVDALANAANYQLIYLYCHAVTTAVGTKYGIDSTCLVLTGDERISLADLRRKAPLSGQLPGHPLVILNACESAELSPQYYDGLVPYFMAKGARGVIGTECKTPALFATEWALKFFPLFLGGMAIGDAMLSIRRDAWTEWNNPLGLLYAVYCDADTRIVPAL